MKKLQAILSLLFSKQFVLLVKEPDNTIGQIYNVDELDKLDFLIRTEEGAMERLAQAYDILLSENEH